MKSKIFRCISTFLAFSLIAAFMATTVPYNSFDADAANVTQADIQKIKDKISANEKKIESNNKKIDSLKNDISNYLEIVEQLEYKISSLENNISDTKDLISKYELLIDQTQTQICEKEDQIATKYESFFEILRLSYEDGTQNYLEILFDSENLVDFLSRVDRLGAIISYEQTVLSELENEITDLNSMKATLEDAKNETVELSTSQEKSEKELQESLKEAEAQLKKLNKDKAALEKVQKEAAALDKELDKELEALIKKYQEQQQADANAKLLWPVDSYNKRISSPFGWRTIWGERDYHTGIDIVGPKSGSIAGDNIYASADGTVLISKYNSSYGNYIVIDHGNTISTCYAHLTKRKVSAGDKVKRGQVIGTVGTTGSSTGYHLHYEVRVNGAKTDPLHKNGSKTESWMVINYNGKYVDPVKNGILDGKLVSDGK